MAKTPAKKAAKPAAAKKASTEAQFAEADAKGAPTADEIDAISVRQGVTGL